MLMIRKQEHNSEAFKEGSIFVDDNYDIRTLKLADLRRCVSVLFQDYTHFPLSVYLLFYSSLLSDWEPNRSRKTLVWGPRTCSR
jgi:ABC-type phosphate transport system ATPase subunit